MRRSIVWTVLQREWFETVRNRLLMSTILIPPILLTVAPILLTAAVGASSLPPELEQQVLAQRPEWASFTPGELAGAFAVQQFLVFFLLMPAYIPLSVATFSIIGEKQARSLEPVLASPIRTQELVGHHEQGTSPRTAQHRREAGAIELDPRRRVKQGG